MVEEVDLAVIGAGFSGLAAAATYLRLHPTARIILLDAADSIGGVWSKERLYPSLKSNNLFGTYEFPSFTMGDGAKYGIKAGEHVPGEMVHQYLNNYAKHTGIAVRTRLGTKVEAVSKLGGQGERAVGWELLLRDVGGEKLTGKPNATSVLHAKKLVVATGVSSSPLLPAIPGAEEFNAPLFHVKHLHEQRQLLGSVRRVAVLGATKSAFDAAYMFATQATAAPDVEVHMIIRASGHGPTWMSPTHVTPLKRWFEKLVTTRALTWMSPCVWAEPADGYTSVRRLLHGTAIGRAIVDNFWTTIGNDLVTLNAYDKHPETKKLKPWVPPFWLGAGLSILNYEQSFWDLVRNGRIRVHVADIDDLSHHAIHLSDGSTLSDVDALVCSTGWKHAPPFQFINIDPADLGLPHASPTPHPLTARADAEIFAKYPRLAHQPTINANIKEPLTAAEDTDAPTRLNQPYRLWRFMVPPALAKQGDNSLAFAGITANIATAVVAEVQALWISAWFDGELTVPEDVEYAATLHSRFGKWRTPLGHGAEYPDFVFDVLPYVDSLVAGLGLQRWRKEGSGGGWLPAWREWFWSYGPEDYRGLVEEYEEVRGVRKEGEN